MSESVQRSEYIKALDRVHDRIDEHAKDDTRVFESINKKLDTLIDRQVDHHTEAVRVIAGMAQQQIEIAELKKKSKIMKGGSGARLFGQWSFPAVVVSLWKNWLG